MEVFGGFQIYQTFLLCNKTKLIYDMFYINKYTNAQMFTLSDSHSVGN